MRRHDRITTHLLELLSSLGPVSARSMFGGVGLFYRRMMFGLIAREELFLKIDETNQPDYEAAGEAPFSYETKHGPHTIRSYWRCPPELLDDPEALQVWARKAVTAAIAGVQSKSKASRRRGERP